MSRHLPALLFCAQFAAMLGSSGSASVPVKPEAVLMQLKVCGVSKAQSKFDNILQETVIEILDSGSGTDDQLRCVVKVSIDTDYQIVFPNAVEQAYYLSIYGALSRERDKADAVAWLGARGLLSRLPKFDPKTSDRTQFARSLEGLCGPRAAGALRLMDTGLTFDERFLEGEVDDDTLTCLLSAATVSNAPLFFVGNAPVN